jgi:hypothetical protein
MKMILIILKYFPGVAPRDALLEATPPLQRATTTLLWSETLADGMAVMSTPTTGPTPPLGAGPVPIMGVATTKSSKE